MMANIVFVCSGGRVEPAMKLFVDAGHNVYHVSQDSIKEYFYHKKNIFTDRNANISECDILLFHTGAEDPKRIPANLKYKYIFSFNSPGEPVDFKGVIKILRPFSSKNEQPFTETVVKEFIEYLNSECQDENLPTICRRISLTKDLRYTYGLCFLLELYLLILYKKGCERAGTILKEEYEDGVLNADYSASEWETYCTSPDLLVQEFSKALPEEYATGLDSEFSLKDTGIAEYKDAIRNLFTHIVNDKKLSNFELTTIQVVFCALRKHYKGCLGIS